MRFEEKQIFSRKCTPSTLMRKYAVLTKKLANLWIISMKNIVTVGGGTGSYTLLRGLKKYNDIHINAIVSMADDGGSTGRLRDELGVLPPGDVRQCLVALSEHTETVRKLMNYRFEEGSLTGHNFGNIFLAALEKVAGTFASGVSVAGEILKIKGEVIPVTEDIATLAIKLKNGDILIGENSINHGNVQSFGVESIYFENDVRLNRHARDAIMHADLIVLGPGNLYCSLLPNLIVNGFKEALKDSRAKIVIPINLTNKKEHTENWGVSDYVNEIEKIIDRKVDIILINNNSPSKEQIELYKIKEGDGVMVLNNMNDARILEKDLLSQEIINFDKSDTVQEIRSFIRHNSDKLAKEIISLL